MLRSRCSSGTDKASKLNVTCLEKEVERLMKRKKHILTLANVGIFQTAMDRKSEENKSDHGTLHGQLMNIVMAQ